MKVTVMARIREGKKYPSVGLVWQGDKLKPRAVIVKDATGREIEVGRPVPWGFTLRVALVLLGPALAKYSLFRVQEKA